MSENRLKFLVRDLNRMMAVTPLNTEDYRVLLEELRKAKIALKKSIDHSPRSTDSNHTVDCGPSTMD